MKLISIEAHGFKSFADKMEIAVNDGITCVVGPNGSGKSNIVDAIRWVLGESSLKEIRGGDTSTDVIFQGSATRKAETRAWVSLTFDNTDHYLATELETVEIKREIYKTGENEYYINNAKCRKKDITDLFLDSGTNPDSYSIIGQGKIQEILKGRPQDRRAIIDEAAGVLKYKKRKEDSLRKLENTKDNIEKIDLVIKELMVSLEPLRLESIEAKKYVEYKEELKGIEIALLAKDIRTINDEYVISKDKLKVLNEELLKLEGTSNIDSSKIEKLKNKLSKLDEEISEVQDSLMSITRDISSLETKKQVLSERKKYEVDDQKLENNILALKEQEVDLKKNINALKANVELLKSELTKNEEALNKSETEYKTQIAKREVVSEDLNKKNRELLILKNKIEMLEADIANDVGVPYAAKSVIANPKLKGIHNVLCKLFETKNEYINAINVSLGANTNVVVVDDTTSATNAIDFLKENNLGRLTFFPISVIKPRYVDPDTLDIAKSVPGFIGVASSLVTTDKLYSSIIDNQLGNILVVDNMDTMKNLGNKIKHRYRIVTLDGEILHTGGALTGGKLNSKQTSIITNKLTLEKYKKNLSILNNEIKLLDNHLNELNGDIKILEPSLVSKRSELSAARAVIEMKNNEINDVTSRLDSITSEIKGTNNVLKNEVDKELDKVLNDLVKTSKEKEEISNKLVLLKTERNELSSEIEEIELINKKQNSEFNKKQNEAHELEVEISKMDVKLDSYLNKLSEEYEMTYERASQEYTLELDETVARSKVNSLKRSINELGEVNIGSIKEYERVNERYTFLATQREDLERASADLLEIITDLDTTMIERFESTFAKVNEEFGKTFRELFKGGKATLILTDPDDLLNTGVDLSACPPGKSLKNMTALSGGEMTLTAIALLFSILNIRIVPFCVLDEVEAALDDANVTAFGEYIEHYRNKSQFIVITHKKKTMEYADTLYGITMQESGVSKLVSVRLEDR